MLSHDKARKSCSNLVAISGVNNLTFLQKVSFHRYLALHPSTLYKAPLLCNLAGATIVGLSGSLASLPSCGSGLLFAAVPWRFLFLDFLLARSWV
jgi:hypothetical protein